MMKNILIVGCGLIGSSIARAVKKNKISKNIFILEKSKQNISIIKKLNIGCKFINNFKKPIIKFDIIILCTPTSQYKNAILKIKQFINNETIITDVGSTKIKSNKRVKEILGNNKKNWISSHPIAGSEVSGAKYGDKNLFKKKWCIIIKDKKSSKKKLLKLMRFWKKLGSKVTFMDSQKHDVIFSVTSHLPHLIAYNLVKTATDFEKNKKYSLIKYSAGGLRDFSRIAASNEIMWRDVFFDNEKNLIKVIDLFIKNLNHFKRSIKYKNNEDLIKKLKETKKVRKKIIKLGHDINRPDFGR